MQAATTSWTWVSSADLGDTPSSGVLVAEIDLWRNFPMKGEGNSRCEKHCYNYTIPLLTVERMHHALVVLFDRAVSSTGNHTKLSQ